MIRVVNGGRETLAPDAIAQFPIGVPGVFETVLWRGGRAIFWAEHWSRFEAGCRAFGVVLPIDQDEVAALIVEVARANGIADGVARFSAWLVQERVGWQVDVSPPRPHMRKSELAVTWGPPLAREPRDAAYKHLSRFEWIAATQQARAAGFDEALLCDARGRVVEGGVSNVFFVRDGCLCTPSLACGPLPGVVRDRVLEHARRENIPVEEGEYQASDVEAGSEIWLTNSLLGIRQAVFANAQAHPRQSSPAPRQEDMLSAFRASWTARYGWDPVVVLP